MQNMKFLYRITGKGMVNSYGQYCGGRSCRSWEELSRKADCKTSGLYLCRYRGAISFCCSPYEKYEDGYHNAEAVSAALPEMTVTLDYAEDGEQHVFLNGADVSLDIRRPEISMAASTVSAIPEVRSFLLGIQRDMAKSYNVVMDGRDIGTVIMPDAQVKIFLCANEHARAKRRFDELTEKGIQTTLEAVELEMKERDHSDSTRKIAPAVPAADAVVLDNSALDRDGTVEAALKIIADKLG